MSKRFVQGHVEPASVKQVPQIVWGSVNLSVSKQPSGVEVREKLGLCTERLYTSSNRGLLLPTAVFRIGRFRNPTPETVLRIWWTAHFIYISLIAQ
jgi:hypothetical protein